MSLGFLDPLYRAVAWVLVHLHDLWSHVFDPGSGAAWALSIVSLVVIIRILLIPLFVKQIKAQRAMSALQPEIKKLQEKYKGDREKLSQEMMALYKERGANPLSGCLPLLVQSPFFFSLFHVLSYMIGRNHPRWSLTPQIVQQAQDAKIFGAPIASTFRMSATDVMRFGGDPTATKIVCIVFIVFMSLTMFFSQRQLMIKNMPTAGNPMAQQQKILLYVFPVVFLFSGLTFPIGVLIYWVTTNLWTTGQQFWVIRRNPTPGTPAYEERLRRLAARGEPTPAPIGSVPAPSAGGSTAITAGSTPAAPGATAAAPQRPDVPRRVQPKRQAKSKRRPATGSRGQGGPAGRTQKRPSGG